MDMLQVAQDRVIEKLNETNDSDVAEAIDPTVWVGILTTVLEIIKNCQNRNKNEAVTAAAIANPTLAQKLLTRREMVKQVGRKAWRQHGDEIHAKLLEVGAEATQAEREAIVREACQK